MIYKQLFFINILNMLVIANVISAEYHFTPGISLSTIYIDNVNLQQQEDEQSDIIYEASPQFKFTADGKKMDVSASYTMQIIEYDKTDGDTINHQLNANTNVEIFEDSLFLDATVTHAQSYIDYDKPVAQNNYAITDNRTDVTTYRVSPKYQTRLWDGAFMEASKTYTRVEYNENSNNELDRETTNVHAKSTILGGDITLGLNYNRSKDKSNNYDYSREYLSVNYSLTPGISIFGEVGKEHANRETSLTNNNSDYYRTGITWVPNNRSKFNATYGEQQLGKTSSLDAVFTSRTKSIGLNYNKQIISAVDIYGEQGNTEESDQGADLNQFGLNDGLFVSEKYQVFITKKLPRSTFTIKYYEEERDYEDEDLDEELDGYNVDWLWRIANRTSLTFAYSDSKNMKEKTKLINTNESISIRVNRKIGSAGNTGFEYTKSDQKFAGGLVRYETQTIRLSLFLSF